MGEWETFAEDVQRNRGTSGRRCGVGELLLGIRDKHARAAIRGALADKTLSAAAIEKTLKERTGASPSSWSIGRHRRGECQCDR